MIDQVLNLSQVIKDKLSIAPEEIPKKAAIVSKRKCFHLLGMLQSEIPIVTGT